MGLRLRHTTNPPCHRIYEIEGKGKMAQSIGRGDGLGLDSTTTASVTNSSGPFSPQN
ncbi:hypothetical protein ASPBRDRAFT_672969 [Aspergillus brasiliensis CBS 101740]|uniref:Uncharacterized protein n=1 Tax=Aspergillus brasiliensis (strain CBS 101740 / IMI 381727 / IBT 21946) TaxID=767769 RepID=A0A1L9UM13_ASPBC|nr:hypothetical protein ASPBRDRAFT_672969 [Aspergillus brasiliensis CBS 101740]